MHPFVEGAARAVAQIGGKAIRRAVDSVMEDGQRAAEDLQRDIMNARDFTRDPGFARDSAPFEVHQVQPRTEEDPMERGTRRRAAREPEEREPRDDEDRDREGSDDPPTSGDLRDIAELTDLRDAETFIRHGWMLLADLSERGIYPKKDADDLEELLGDLRDLIEERDV